MIKTSHFFSIIEYTESVLSFTLDMIAALILYLLKRSFKTFSTFEISILSNKRCLSFSNTDILVDVLPISTTRFKRLFSSM
ncbi:hypothetical protein JBKA6_1340 [Ichthyobacterium seriolicida]|uniref:Uncharacterized protein n=1 Tax=Ichthyobacterium seriolicida TaxID=242600 RepID=A0A1J1DZN0_9FLAO|nr:hypothetical protein JBKA6_1340 [Ichthyobacterium seriolicida]